jgi:hypothetical protein
MLGAAIALSWAIWNAEWRANDTAFAFAVVTLVLLSGSIVAPNSWVLARWINPVLPLVLTGVFAFFARLVLSFSSETYFTSLVLAMATLIGVGLARNPALEHWRIPVFLAVYAALGVWRIKATPSPHIDVWVWHNEALQALLHGRNPYAGTMPNIYENARFYDPSMVVDGRVLTGFQYPPVSLYFAMPGYLLAGDYRYSMLAAMLVAGACMAYASPNGFGPLAMALWLGAPRNLFILVHGFTEPMLVMWLALFLFCVVRGWRFAFIPLGFLLAGKQYVPMFAAALWLLPSSDGQLRAKLRLILYGLVFGGLVTLPFFIINPKAFYECMVLLQIRQPFRIESLGLVAWWFIHHQALLPSWLGFASVLLTSALVLWRCERTASGVAAAFAFISFLFAGLSKQPFANHYFFTFGAMCCAIAFVRPDSRYRHGF